MVVKNEQKTKQKSPCMANHKFTHFVEIEEFSVLCDMRKI